MKIRIYKGLQKNGIPMYLWTNENVYSVDEIDEFGNPFIFVGMDTINGDIVSWKPFLAVMENGTQRTFICPSCGSKSCERENKNFSDPSYYQGYFKCSACGVDGFCYYSECFKRLNIVEKQLSLF